MPRRFKVLSGTEVIKIFESFGFSVTDQKGSHVKMVRLVEGTRHILVVPKHKELKQGTTSALFTQASLYIDESELKEYFVQL